MRDWIISTKQLAILYAKFGGRMCDQDGKPVKFDPDDVNKEIRLNEVVRCCDCKHYHPELYLHIKCEYHCLNVEPDDFCSYGERRPE